MRMLQCCRTLVRGNPTSRPPKRQTWREAAADARALSRRSSPAPPVWSVVRLFTPALTGFVLAAGLVDLVQHGIDVGVMLRDGKVAG